MTIRKAFGVRFRGASSGRTGALVKRKPFCGLSEAEFDCRVRQIRARGVAPAVIPKPYNKKALATPEQWAAQLEYDAIKRRRWRAGLTKPQRVQYKKGHIWIDEATETSNTAVQDSEQRPVGTQGRVHECVLVQCSCGSEPRWVPVGELNHSNPKKRLRGCQQCKGAAMTARALEEFPGHKVGEAIGRRTVVAVGEIEQKRNGENIRFDQRMTLKCECGTLDEVWHSSLHAVSDKCRFCIANENIERVPIGTTYGDQVTSLTTISEPYFTDAFPIAPSKRHIQVRTLVVDAQCSCPEENIITVRFASLKSGNTKSCGCRQSRVTSSRNVAEDQASKPLTCRWLYRNQGQEILMRSSWELSFGAPKPATHRRFKTGHQGGGCWVEESSDSVLDARGCVQDLRSLSVVRSLGGRIPRSFPVGALAGFGGVGWSVLGSAGFGSSGAWRFLSR